jgi:tRNA A-37 threonylcarbamoyl transferase component Bud32
MTAVHVLVALLALLISFLQGIPIHTLHSLTHAYHGLDHHQGLVVLLLITYAAIYVYDYVNQVLKATAKVRTILKTESDDHFWKNSTSLKPDHELKLVVNSSKDQYCENGETPDAASDYVAIEIGSEPDPANQLDDIIPSFTPELAWVGDVFRKEQVVDDLESEFGSLAYEFVEKRIFHQDTQQLPSFRQLSHNSYSKIRVYELCDDVVVKSFPKDQRHSFVNEVRIGWLLQDSGYAVKHIRTFETPESSGIMMKKYPNGDLETFSNKNPDANLLIIFLGMVRAVAAIHSKGFAHCDVKPPNFLLDGSGNVVISDFGTVSRFGSTLKYPPECKYHYDSGESLVDESRDVYSLGVSFCELMERNERLTDYQWRSLAELTNRMTNRVGSRRPSMQEVQRELEKLLH